MATRIKEKYLAEAVPALKQKFGYKNVMEIPKLAKIVINMGLGDCKDNAKAMEMAVNELTTIAGQKPMITKAAGRPDGRVHGQARERGPAPRPRLPRRERQGL